ncbi:unnamed protein product [Nippostrongylus brasiliensis]|uniref:Secreted protein n=1 Tax=Nippostrongylus brasiliensis TaxID=27835 RepID=A0A0N4YGZ5_NIPBR|nr:unnamed protein product [Nippostrongylus brasiliensis]
MRFAVVRTLLLRVECSIDVCTKRSSHSAGSILSHLSELSEGKNIETLPLFDSSNSKVPARPVVKKFDVD